MYILFLEKIKMAIVNIQPLSIGGFSGPNILNAFLGSFTPQNMVYPMDLATNPAYCHAVQFSIFDFESKAGALLAGAANKLTDFASATILNPSGSVEELAKQAKELGTLEGAGNELLKLGQDAATLVTASNYLPSKTNRKLRSTISLYMPDTLNIDYNSNYADASMTDTFGLLGYVGNAIAGSPGNLSLNKDNVANIVSGAKPFIQNAAIGLIPGKEGLKGVLQNAVQSVPNPQMQLIYKGISLRNFQLEFIFTPVSAQEAQAVEKIINSFVYYSVPDFVNQTNGQFLKPPQVFAIKFAFTGQQGVIGAIQNVLTSTLTNIVGSQLTGMLTGSNPDNKISNAAKAKIFEVGDCVLKNVTTDYAPNGWATYGDGYPIQTRMTLQFQEMNIVTKSLLDEQGKGFGLGSSSGSGGSKYTALDKLAAGYNGPNGESVGS
jgi:hypothetical protein